MYQKDEKDVPWYVEEMRCFSPPTRQSSFEYADLWNFARQLVSTLTMKEELIQECMKSITSYDPNAMFNAMLAGMAIGNPESAEWAKGLLVKPAKVE